MRAAIVCILSFVVGSCGGMRIEGDASDGRDPGPDHVIELPGGDGEDEGRPRECPDQLALCNGYCLDLGYDVSHCGTCGNTCSADEACIVGTCRDLCEEVTISTHDGLVRRLLDLSWVSTWGVMGYATVTEDIEVLSSELGDGYMFVSDLDTLHLENEVLYGFDDMGHYCDYSIYPPYPSVAYERMVIEAGTSFIAVSSEYYDHGPSSGSCPEGMYCIGLAIHPMTEMCCCYGEPFEWHVIEISEAPSVCLSGVEPCESDLAWTDHSLCYAIYRDYLEEVLDVHLECVDHERGFVLMGSECTCHIVCGGDIAETLTGTCTERGYCDVDMPHDVSDDGRGCE